MPSLWRSWSVWWSHLEIKRSKQVPSKAVSRAFLSLARFQVDPPISHSEPSTSLWGQTFTSCEVSDSIISQSSPLQTGCVACARFVSPGSSKGAQKQAVVPAVRSPGRSTRHHQDLLRGIPPCPRGPRGPSWCWHAAWTTWLLPGKRSLFQSRPCGHTSFRFTEMFGVSSVSLKGWRLTCAHRNVSSFRPENSITPTCYDSYKRWRPALVVNLLVSKLLDASVEVRCGRQSSGWNQLYNNHGW